MTVPEDRSDFGGIPLVPWTASGFIFHMMNLAATRERSAPAFVSYLNAWCYDLACRDAEYAKLLRKADAVYADGQAIVWASRVLGAPVPERVNAADFISDFCRAAAERHLSLYLLGSALGTAQGAAARFAEMAPGLQIAGTHSGYFDSDEEVVADIAAAAPDILLVGMGVPRQEKWVAAHLTQLNAKVVWCVGALFEYYAGQRARAPVWVRKAGLEWAFRLALEPRRLWRRYLLGNAEFVWRVLNARASRQ